MYVEDVLWWNWRRDWHRGSEFEYRRKKRTSPHACSLVLTDALWGKNVAIANQGLWHDRGQSARTNHQTTLVALCWRRAGRRNSPCHDRYEPNACTGVSTYIRLIKSSCEAGSIVELGGSEHHFYYCELYWVLNRISEKLFLSSW